MTILEKFLSEVDIDTKYMQNKKDLESFVSYYTVDRISALNLEEYYYIGHKSSFCYRLKEGLKDFSSMGNVRPNVFGIRLDADNRIVLNQALEKLYGNDYNEAFKRVKKEIIKTISDSSGKYTSDEAIIYQQMRFKLLSVYYPNIYFPVCTENPTAREYCNALGIIIKPTDDMMTLNHKLSKWSREHLPGTWTLYHAMAFADWLWRNKICLEEGFSAKITDMDKAENIEKEIESLHLKGEEKEAVVRQRVNQSVFRDMLLSKYDHCCLCPVGNSQMLVASHIKPWSESKAEEKLDVNNGFLMCPNHDRLFDRGFISFDDEGNIIISNSLSETDRICMNVRKNTKIGLTDGNRKYLEYHREKIFKH